MADSGAGSASVTSTSSSKSESSSKAVVGSSVGSDANLGRGRHVVIAPGNGCDRIKDCNWYSWLADELTARGFRVSFHDMPDPDVARESIWLPFIREQLGCDEHSIIVGHSSGAEAAMRLMETQRVYGAALIAACHSDMGIENEAASGYYNRPWRWDAIRGNARWILQLGAKNDKHVPIDEQRQVAEWLRTNFTEAKFGGHFLAPTNPPLLEMLLKQIRADNAADDAAAAAGAVAGATAAGGAAASAEKQSDSTASTKSNI
jgi:hypothetical protein